MRISDWSSDVCSFRSRIADQAFDNRVVGAFAQVGELVDPMMGGAVPADLLQADHVGVALLQDGDDASHSEVPVAADRPEERSVGKESDSTCRSRWTPAH